MFSVAHDDSFEESALLDWSFVPLVQVVPYWCRDDVRNQNAFVKSSLSELVIAAVTGIFSRRRWWKLSHDSLTYIGSNPRLESAPSLVCNVAGKENMIQVQRSVSSLELPVSES